MIPVYICEDEEEQLKAMMKMIDNFILINSFDMKIEGCFQTPGEFLQFITEQKPLTALYFLDIDLKSEINGIKLAEKIREYDPRAFIIFITTHEEMAMYTLKKRVEPLDFIVKGSSDFASQIETCLRNTIRRFSIPDNPITDVMTIRILDSYVFVRKQDIFFIESAQEPHKIIIHKEKEQLVFRSSLKSLSTQLDKRFFRCHGSFIVNLEHIEKVDRQSLFVHFSNKETCPCSTRLYSKLIKSLS